MKNDRHDKSDKIDSQTYKVYASRIFIFIKIGT